MLTKKEVKKLKVGDVVLLERTGKGYFGFNEPCTTFREGFKQGEIGIAEIFNITGSFVSFLVRDRHIPITQESKILTGCDSELVKIVALLSSSEETKPIEEELKERDKR